ncbi:RDD family protein [Mucilaginibacter corticis]|uniref:RDD family protein n=1 Tax=Mucilaginibacter corticis TaxID=2597670 RepID=A0A556MFD4_9SPHI|nr:RDD family protein [Mucilaginibacter corticis]TSJ38644.1 RDD family protein [Mucilaginibacter corticis]
MTSTQNTFILVINGKPEGPFTIDELRSRQIKPGDFVKTGDMSDYKEAREVAELRELLGFKNEVFLQYYASFDQRATAAVLDWVFVAGTCILLLFVASLFIEKQLVVFALILALLIIVPIVYLIYHMMMESSAKQATFGKRIIKIKVCDMQGNRLSFAHAAGRNLAKVLSVGTLAIGYLYAFFNKQQQCLHDKVAGTLVIKDRL